MCKCNGESIDHLFLHCPIAMDLWAMVFSLFGASMLARQIWSSSKWVYMVDCSPLLIVVSLEERNSKCFENKERSILELKLFFFRTLMDWLAALRNQSFFSFLDFLDSCNFCSDRKSVV